MSAPQTPLAIALGTQQQAPLSSQDNAVLAGLSPNTVMASPFGLPQMRADIAEKLGAVKSPDIGWMEGFAKSTIWSAGPELIGMDIGEPWPEAERWRLRNPGSTLLSHLVGGIPAFLFPGPALSGAVARGLPPLAKAFSVADDLAAAGKIFKAGALRETARFAPLMAAQAVGSVLAPQEGTAGRTAKMLAVQIPAFGVLGGVGNVFANRMAKANFPAARRGAESFVGWEARLSQETSYPLNQTPQQKWQYLRWLEDQAAGAPEAAYKLDPLRPMIEKIRFGLESQILSEEFVGRPVHRVVQGLGLTNRLNGLFAPGVRSGVSTKRFVLNSEKAGVKDGFATTDELLANTPERLLGVEDYQGSVQGLRRIETLNQNGSARIHKAINEMTPIGDGVWMAEEGAEGAYVILKSLPGAPKRGTGGLLGMRTFERDSWLLFKTTNPGKFAEGGGSLNERMAQVFLKKDFHTRADPAVPKETTPTLSSIEAQEQTLRPIQQAIHGTPKAVDENGFVVRKGPIGGMLDSLMPEAWVKNRAAAMELGAGLGKTMQGGMSPALHEVSSNPRAVAITAQMQNAFDEMTFRTKNLLHGPPLTPDPKRGFLHQRIFTTQKQREGGVMKMVDDFDEQDLQEFTRAWVEGVSPDEAFERAYGDKVVALLKRLDKEIDDPFVRELHATRKALGLEDGFQHKKFHYHITRGWFGDFRLPIYDLSGKVVGMGSGHSRQQATAEARTLIERINASLDDPVLLTYDFMEESGEKLVLRQGGRAERVRQVGPQDQEILRVKDHEYTNVRTDPRARQAEQQLKESDVFQIARDIDPENALVRRIMAERAKLFAEEPGRFNPRAGKIGFGGSTRPLTKSEIKERIASNIMESQRLLTKESLESVLKPELTRLASEDMTSFNRIINRFNSHMGIQGPVARQIDYHMDKVLAPMFGPRAASKAVRGMNQALFFLTLGAGDMGFATLNALTPLQTVLPEIAFSLSTPPERLAAYYSAALFESGRGLRAVSFLDPIKLMRRTMKDLGKNADEITKREMLKAGEKNIVTRQGVEAYMGADVQEIGRLGQVFTGGENLMDWVKALSAAPVAMSEEFARTYAFAAGRRTYLDFLAPSRLVGEQLQDAAFEFARRFTLRTNFGYGTADRPRVLTGAVGTGWGLFRNWTFNYLHNLGTYTNAAFGRKNFMPLAWSMLGTGTVGGVAAMPFYGMINGFSKLTSDKSLESQAYELMGGDPTSARAADMLMYGPLAGLGFTLQSRASVPGTEFLRDMSMMSNMLVLDRGKALGKSLGLVGENVGMGRNPFNDDRFVRSMMQGFAPRTLQHAWQVWDGNHKSLNTGNVLAGDVSRFGAIATMFGFQSTDVRKLFSVSDELYKDQQAQRAIIQQYGALLDQAWDTGTPEDVNGMIWRAYTAGVPIESVIRSAQSRERKRYGDYIERQFDDYKITQMRRVRGLGY